jgi:hypothetical protein
MPDPMKLAAVSLDNKVEQPESLYSETEVVPTPTVPFTNGVVEVLLGETGLTDK